MPKVIINKIECYRISSKYGDGKVFGQARGVKSITIIAIHTNKKIIGYGETYAGVYTPDVIDEIVKYLSSYFIGKQINNEKILDQINIPFVGQYGLIKSVLSGIEIAIYDILSKIHKLSLSKYLNHKSSNSINIYASGGSVTYDIKEILKEVNYIQDKGFKSYKMRVGFQSLKKDIGRVTNAINNLNYDSKLMIDAIMGSLKKKWNYNEAISFISNIKSKKILWIEEPLDPSNLKDYSKLRLNSKIPIAFGESFTNINEFTNSLLLNCSHYLQPDVTHCGIQDSKRLVKIKNKIKIAMHCWGSPISFLANLNFALAYSKVEYMEYPLVKLEFMEHQLDNLIYIQKGKIVFNNEVVGLGLNIDKEYLNKFKFIKKSGWSI
tara:strand:+ start:6159 stop:7295 length:1137 start_codon:yes stop_codon:yes gene_type:complete